MRIPGLLLLLSLVSIQALAQTSPLSTYTNGLPSQIPAGTENVPCIAGSTAKKCTTAAISAAAAFTGDCTKSANGTVITCSSTTKKIASGTVSLGTSAIASGACAAVVTVSATGVLTTDSINWGFNGDTSGITGYTTSDSLDIRPYPSADNVNFKVCNRGASSVTPGAVTLNWQVSR